MASQNDHANWDLMSYFPLFDGPDYQAHRDGLEQSLRSLEAQGRRLGLISAEHMAGWVDLLLDIERRVVEYSHLASYLGCLVAADSLNEVYKREQARMGNGAYRSRSIRHLLAAGCGYSSERVLLLQYLFGSVRAIK